jgi:hypothetical protein
VVVALAVIRSRAGVLLFVPTLAVSLLLAWRSAGRHSSLPLLALFGGATIVLLAIFAFAMGPVLAHEICHILEGIPRHSGSGLMKARFDWRDMIEMRGGGLKFAPDDEVLLHRRFAPAAATDAP